jgi:hypothetical protein
VKRHSDYGRQERGRLRRVARREVPEVSTLGPDQKTQAKPFAVELSTERALEDWPRRAAAGVLMTEACAEDLGIDMPTVCLLMRVSPAQAGHLVEKGLAEEMGLRRIDITAGGLASADRVSLMMRRQAGEVARIAAHETRHVAQPEPLRTDHDRAEEDARSYAEDAMQRLWPAVADRICEDLTD